MGHDVSSGHTPSDLGQRVGMQLSHRLRLTISHRGAKHVEMLLKG